MVEAHRRRDLRRGEQGTEAGQATILANAVPNLKVVQQQLGHTSIMTTYAYVHPDLNAMRDALGAL